MLAALAVLLSVPSYAQKSIPRNIGNFSALKVSSGIDVYLTQGNAPAMEIETDEETLKRLIVEVDNNNTLVLRMENPKGWNWFSAFSPVKVRLTFTQLNDIKVSGGSDLFGQGTLNFDLLRIQASGGSDVKMNLRAKELDVQCSGGSDVVLEGAVTSFKGKASGGSDIKAIDLQAEVADVSASGGSDALIRVTRQLSANASGGSDIVYTGNPEKVNSNASGGSDIKKR